MDHIFLSNPKTKGDKAEMSRDSRMNKVKLPPRNLKLPTLMDMRDELKMKIRI
tara:strand:- start:6799 stop:6957 length:159 start_codon:yes stop_codon:yes gene_type:complete